MHNVCVRTQEGFEYIEDNDFDDQPDEEIVIEFEDEPNRNLVRARGAAVRDRIVQNMPPATQAELRKMGVGGRRN